MAVAKVTLFHYHLVFCSRLFFFLQIYLFLISELFYPAGLSIFGRFLFLTHIGLQICNLEIKIIKGRTLLVTGIMSLFILRYFFFFFPRSPSFLTHPVATPCNSCSWNNSFFLSCSSVSLDHHSCPKKRQQIWKYKTIINNDVQHILYIYSV